MTTRHTLRCGAQGRTGTPCRKSAGWGTDHAGYGHCRLHGGASPNGRVFAAKLEAAAKAEHVARVMGFRSTSIRSLHS